MSAPTMTPGQREQLRAGRRALLERNRAVAEARFEDLEFLLSHGEDLDRAFRRIGCRRDVMIGSARRWGRHDIVTLIREATR